MVSTKKSKGECQYHLCDKLATAKCKHCEKHFCKKHMNPTLVGMPRFRGTTHEDKQFMVDWEKPGHPCLQFVDYWNAENEERKEREYRALDHIISSESFSVPEQRPNSILASAPTPHATRSPIEKMKFWENKQKNRAAQNKKTPSKEPAHRQANDSARFLSVATHGTGWLRGKLTFILLVLAVLAVLFIIFMPRVSTTTGLACSDGTQDWSCSLTKPYQCVNGSLAIKAGVCGCPEGKHAKGDWCIAFQDCAGGAKHGSCSGMLPLYCDDGKLVNKSGVCGCPNDYRPKEESCIKILRCADGTEYWNCASAKPSYCENGTIIDKASSCGCPDKEEPYGESCVPRFQTQPQKKQFSYVLRGTTGVIDFTVYRGLKDYLTGLDRAYQCYEPCPPAEEIQQILDLRQLDQEDQTKQLLPLVSAIKSTTANPDDQARIAVSLVQRIPYDWEGFTTNNLNGRYPYEVLYDDKGVCGEKAKLLAFILRELGYGVALFNYPNHQTVGIKCPAQYSFEGTGYCFIETSDTTIITDSKSEYYITPTTLAKLPPNPKLVQISNGASFDTVSEEYDDASTLIRIHSFGRYIGVSMYAVWQGLINKYGIETK